MCGCVVCVCLVLLVSARVAPVLLLVLLGMAVLLCLVLMVFLCLTLQQEECMTLVSNMLL